MEAKINPATTVTRVETIPETVTITMSRYYV